MNKLNQPVTIKGLRTVFSRCLLGLICWTVTACQVEKPMQSSAQNQNAMNPVNRVGWRALLMWNDDCEQAFLSTQATGYSGVETYALAKDDTLVIVMCAVASYQPSFLLYRLQAFTAQPLTLTTYLSSDGETLQRERQNELWGEPVFFKDTGKLIIFTAARQTKDCGTWAQYGFTAESATLEKLHYRLPCPAVPVEPLTVNPVIPPAHWNPYAVK